jgi:hypothetical protein
MAAHRQSVARLRLRALLAADKQETLLPCPACNGKKQVFKEFPGGRYQMHACRWCDGTGSVDTVMMRVFLRWRRIWQINTLGGRCS